MQVFASNDDVHCIYYFLIRFLGYSRQLLFVAQFHFIIRSKRCDLSFITNSFWFCATKWIQFSYLHIPIHTRIRTGMSKGRDLRGHRQIRKVVHFRPKIEKIWNPIQKIINLKNLLKCLEVLKTTFLNNYMLSCILLLLSLFFITHPYSRYT